MIDVQLILSLLPDFSVAAVHTLQLVLTASAGGLALGFLINLLRVFGCRPVRAMLMAYTQGLRFTPFLAQLFVVYYGLPVFGVTLSPLQAAVLTLSAYSSAYFAEIFRSCWDTIPKGQLEAAATLGISRLQAFRAIEMPQALKLSVPLLTNQVILVLKESALASIITYPELTMTAGKVVAEQFTYVEPYLLLSAVYWLLTLLIGAAGRRWAVTLNRPSRSPQ